MTLLRFVALSVLMAGFPSPGYSVNAEMYLGQSIFEHGGGCRKSSPPGQCCHMETASGTVHCH